MNSRTSAYATCASTAGDERARGVKRRRHRRASPPPRVARVLRPVRASTAHAIGSGSATPVVSRTIASRSGSSSHSSSNVRSRSSPITQHTQPPGSLICRVVATPSNAPSMPTAPSSLTMMPSLPVSPVRRGTPRASSRLTSVVFPLPRKPVKTTSGTRTPAAYRLNDHRAITLAAGFSTTTTLRLPAAVSGMSSTYSTENGVARQVLRARTRGSRATPSAGSRCRVVRHDLHARRCRRRFWITWNLRAT